MILITLMSITTQSEVVEKSFPTKDIKKVRVEIIAGNVSISKSNEATATIKLEKIKFEEECALTMETKEGELLLLVKDKKILGSSNCQVNTTLKLPSQMKVDVESGSGTLKIIGMTNDIDFSLGSGSVEIEGKGDEIDGNTGSGKVVILGSYKEIDIKTGNGDINFNGECEDAKFKTGNGDAEIRYSKNVMKGKLDVMSGNGDALVYLPSSVKVSTSLMTGFGRVYSQLDEMDDSPFQVSLKTGNGDLKVLKLD